MKRTSKRLVGILLCLAFVLALVPMAALAADTTTVYYYNGASNWATVSVHYWGGADGSTNWPGVAATDLGNGYWSAEVPSDITGIIFNNGGNGGQTGDLTLPTDGKNCFAGTEWVEYTGGDIVIEAAYFVAGDASLCGSAWNPGDAANKMTLADDGKYYIEYANVAAGPYNLKVTDGTWNNAWGPEGNVAGSGNLSITAAEGDTVVVCFDPAGEGTATVYIKAAGGDEGETVVVDAGSVELNSSNDEKKVIEWTAPADGTLTVAVSSDSTPGSEYVVEMPDGSTTIPSQGSSDRSTEIEVTAGETYKISFACFSLSTWSYANGTVVYEVTFTESAGSSVVVPEEFVISNTTLEEDSNIVDMEPNALNTLFVFAPTRTGIFTITAPEGVEIGDWNATFYPYDKTVNKTNTLVFTCTEVGQEFLIGVAGSESVELVITQEEYIPPVVLPWVDYENTFDFNFTLPEGEVIDIDTTDEVADVAVLGADGFYHYGSKFGPLMVCNLSEVEIDLRESLNWGPVRAIVFDEDGNEVARWDYSAAVLEYLNAGLCPVTPELAAMIQNLGAAQSWWMAGGFVFTEENPTLDEADAWMEFCAYIEGSEITPEYFVTGNADWLGNWDAAFIGGGMELTTDGVYTVTFENVPAGEYQFKVTDGTWNNSWGGDGPDGNYLVTVEEAGDLTITFNSETNEITVAISGEEIPETSDASFVAIIVLMVLVSTVCVVATTKKFF